VKCLGFVQVIIVKPLVDDDAVAKDGRFNVKALDETAIRLLLPAYPASLRAQDIESSTMSV
jgi:hypothetical protein